MASHDLTKPENGEHSPSFAYVSAVEGKVEVPESVSAVDEFTAPVDPHPIRSFPPCVLDAY